MKLIDYMCTGLPVIASPYGALHNAIEDIHVLYAIENQIRSKIPLTYLDTWDDLPYPMWNKPFYKSCDALFAISKQTDNINKWVLGPENCTSIHGDFDKDGNIIKG